MHPPTARTARWARDDGVIALEFALLAPVFVLLIVAVMVLSIYFGAVVAVIHGAAEGARASIGGLGATERQTLATARVKEIFEGYEPMLDADDVTVTMTSSAVPGSFNVQVSYPLDTLGAGPLFSLLGLVTGDSGGQPQMISRTMTVANGGY